MLVRHATSTDIPILLGLDHQSTMAAHWSQAQYEKIVPAKGVHSSDRLTLVVEAAEDKPAIQPSHIPGISPEIAAFLVAKRVDTEWELENIVVAEKYRRRGLAKLLLWELIRHAEEQDGGFILLEVRESNEAARALYEYFRFEMTGRRKNYYSNPPGDAILYRRVVKKIS